MSNSPNNLAFVFPGQGSQSVGMLAKLAAGSPVIRSTFDEASKALGYDLWTLCSEGPLENLNETERTQPAMLVAGIATWRLWQERGGPSVVAPDSAGHGGAYATNMSIYQDKGLITVWMVQHAGFPGEGKKAQEAFKTAALATFATPAR